MAVFTSIVIINPLIFKEGTWDRTTPLEAERFHSERDGLLDGVWDDFHAVATHEGTSRVPLHCEVCQPFVTLNQAAGGYIRSAAPAKYHDKLIPNYCTLDSSRTSCQRLGTHLVAA